MIDPHVHLRDWQQAGKETVKHGLMVAGKAGLDGVFEMPNTDPALVTEKRLLDRIQLADAAGSAVFHGIYGGLTADADQVKAMVKAYKRLFPRVVGFKLFAGSSTGDLAVTDEALQFEVFQVLAACSYRGVVAVHCEKESLFKPGLWEPAIPFTHSLCRTPESETASIRDIILFAQKAGFKGHVHICHVSVPVSVAIIEQARQTAAFSLSCGITPHHSLLNSAMVKTNSLLKINPPLRDVTLQEQMIALLLEGKISWIETDHAPHALEDKPAASGIPGLPYLPHFIRKLKALGITDSLLQKITHDNINAAFKLEIPDTGKAADYNLAREYPFDPFI